jgi:hypothetical protein
MVMRRVLAYGQLASLAVGVLLGLAISEAKSTIVTITTATEGNKLNLATIEITSGSGNPNRIVTFDQLSKIDVIDYLSVPEANTTNTVTVIGTPDSTPPSGQDRLTLLSDAALNTGIFNPSDVATGLTVAFDPPLINGPSEDFVLFEFATGSGQTPDPFVVRQLGGVGTPRSVTTSLYQKSGAIPAASAPVTYLLIVAEGASASFDDLKNAPVTASAAGSPKWYAVPVDLTALGVADGASVNALEFLSGDRTRAVDPLLIAGLWPYVAGDYDHNGSVDASDYVVWRRTTGQIGTGLAADGTGVGGVPDGVVDQLDYDFWRSNFGRTTVGGGAAAQIMTVPEPTTLAPFAGVWLVLMIHRSRSLARSQRHHQGKRS